MDEEMSQKGISKEDVEKGVGLLFGRVEDVNFVEGGQGSGRGVSSESVEEIDEAVESENVRKIEAALFISGRFLSLQELLMLTDVNPILLRKLLKDLSDKYREGGIEIIEQEGKWKMDVAEDYKDIVNKLATGESEFSKAEQESLAIIAFKQPMKQSILVKIRGNKAYDHVKRFVEMGLINKKRVGHTSELKLSDSFYDYFHLGRGEKLPELDDDEE